MGFYRVQDIATAYDNGQSWTSWFHKTGTPTVGTAAYWADMSMGAGVPRFNAWAGNQGESNQLIGSANNGIYLPPVASGYTRHVLNLTIQSSAATMFPATFILCDYLLFYPLVDMDSTDSQEFTNTQTLPRYTSGEGVQAIIVSTVAQSASALCTVSYTNSEGVSGRTATFYTSVANTGQMINGIAANPVAGQQSPFLQLQSGDRGIRQIDAIQNAAGAGGFATICLVKPLTETLIREQNTFNERHLIQHKGANLPRVYDGAYLNFIYLPSQAAASSVVRGSVDFVWGDGT